MLFWICFWPAMGGTSWCFPPKNVPCRIMYVFLPHEGQIVGVHEHWRSLPPNKCFFPPHSSLSIPGWNDFFRLNKRLRFSWYAKLLWGTVSSEGKERWLMTVESRFKGLKGLKGHWEAEPLTVPCNAVVYSTSVWLGLKNSKPTHNAFKEKTFVEKPGNQQAWLRSQRLKKLKGPLQ